MPLFAETSSPKQRSDTGVIASIKRTAKRAGQSAKKFPGATASVVKEVVKDPGGKANAVARTFGKNTARFANQAVTEGKQAINTVRQAVDTDNYSAATREYNKAVEEGDKDRIAAAKKQLESTSTSVTEDSERAEKDLEGFKNSGGLFNAGTLNTEEEARRGDLKSGAKKIGAGTAGVATEVLPFARGLGMGGSKGALYAARGVDVASKLSTGGSRAARAAALLAEGAGYGAANSIVDSTVEDKPLTPIDVAKNALIGAGAAGGTKLAAKGISRLVGGKKPASEETLPNLTDEDTKGMLPVKIPVEQADDVSVGTATKVLPDIPSRVAPERVPVDDVDFRATFKSGADEAAKLPVVAKLGNTNTSDTVSFVMSALANAKSTGRIEKITRKLVPDLTNKENRELAVKLKDTGNEEGVKELLNAASQNTQANPQPIAPVTKIAFNDVADDTMTPVQRAQAALVGDAGSASTYVPVKRGDFVEPPLTTNIDTRVTTPDDAKNLISLAKTNTPSTSMTVSPSKRAQAALVGEPSISTKVDEEPVTEIGEGAQSIFKALNKQLSDFSDKYKAPESLEKYLDNSKAVTSKGRDNDWLDHYEDTLGVLGRRLGDVGTNIGYKFAEGAKVRADIQETLLPTAKRALDSLERITKSEAGKTDVQTRIYQALEDRVNAENILKGETEKKMFQDVVSVLDWVKDERIRRGKSVVGENYSPRAAVRDALEAPDRMFESARSAFGRDASSSFSKQRSQEIPDADINRRIIELLPQYISSQAKEFAYEGAIDYMKKELPNINPAFLTDTKSVRRGTEYLQTMVKQVLDPRMATKWEQTQNKLIANTYRNQLGFSLKYAVTNLTQRFSTAANTTKEARKLAGEIDKADIDSLRKGLISGDTSVSSEAFQSADNTLGSSEGKVDAFFRRFDPGAKTEKYNIHNAFDVGVAQAIKDSEPYKQAIKFGMSAKDAAKEALKDESVRDAAVRRGNVVMNDTQFGANFILKPEFFRNSGTFFGLSDKWYKQYQRFPFGMIQQATTILKANDARALDILRRGNPAETNLVDYRKSAEALSSGVDDIINGIKAGEIKDVPLEVAQGYKKSLQKATTELNKEMKKVSLVRGGKTAKSFASMWAAASAIQFLFDGGLFRSDEEQSQAAAKAARYGAPLSVPTRDQNPLVGSFIPSSPLRPNGNFDTGKLLNFVPGVGLAYSRGKEVKRFTDALTDDN